MFIFLVYFYLNVCFVINIVWFIIYVKYRFWNVVICYLKLMIWNIVLIIVYYWDKYRFMVNILVNRLMFYIKIIKWKIC